MYQYWFASALIIGISVANLLLSNYLRPGAIRRCQSALFGVVSSAQGIILVATGFLVLFFGIKELKDILLEEETRSLLERARFQEDSRTSSDTESHMSGNNNSSSAINANVSRATSRTDPGHFAQKVNTVPASYAGPNRSPVNQSNINQNRAPIVPLYSTPASSMTADQANVTTKIGMPPRNYQPPPGHYQQPPPPKNNFSSPNKNNYLPISNNSAYPPSSNKNAYPPTSSNLNYSLSNKSNSSLIGPKMPGQIPSNSKPNNYSTQPLPPENYPVALPERSYATDRYGPQTSLQNPMSYSSPLSNFSGKSKPSMRQPAVPPSSNWNYPPNTRQPAMVNNLPPPVNISRHPSPVPSIRSQQNIQGYQAGGDDYANDYNDYVIPSNAYNVRPVDVKTYTPNLTRGGMNQ
ncbi:9330_t:CDS:2 [Acaulospora colombiana]|uniref:9330_t:CDS:1 n=1 Tax=Acaulospora colombiana TaxID=27376 RepID=A0ACA9M1V9_9GLOM|nr:9330_t:CDS:2 [Acaulospora colombiana]